MTKKINRNFRNDYTIELYLDVLITELKYSFYVGLEKKLVQELKRLVVGNNKFKLLSENNFTVDINISDDNVDIICYFEAEGLDERLEIKSKYDDLDLIETDPKLLAKAIFDFYKDARKIKLDAIATNKSPTKSYFKKILSATKLGDASYISFNYNDGTNDKLYIDKNIEYLIKGGNYILKDEKGGIEFIKASAVN